MRRLVNQSNTPLHEGQGSCTPARHGTRRADHVRLTSRGSSSEQNGISPHGIAQPMIEPQPRHVTKHAWAPTCAPHRGARRGWQRTHAPQLGREAGGRLAVVGVRTGRLVAAVLRSFRPSIETHGLKTIRTEPLGPSQPSSVSGLRGSIRVCLEALRL